MIMREKERVLNLYAGLGGNRKLWPESVEVTAVEFNPDIAAVYSSLYPNDTVIVADAHKYLLDHYKEFDFIWSSPPCQSHSSFRHNMCVRYKGTPEKYPDMTLYEEIVFLKHYFKRKWVVENVVPYYGELIPARKLNRHLYWANFELSDIPKSGEVIRSMQIPDLQKLHGIDLTGVKISNKRQILRNCVSPEAGLSIYNDFIKSTRL